MYTHLHIIALLFAIEMFFSSLLKNRPSLSLSRSQSFVPSITYTLHLRLVYTQFEMINKVLTHAVYAHNSRSNEKQKKKRQRKRARGKRRIENCAVCISNVAIRLLRHSIPEINIVL